MTASRALVVTEPGGPGVLAIQDRDIPDPGPGEVQVRLDAVGVNFIDVYRRQGIYPTRTPFVACSEGAGTVTAVGDDVDLSTGARVAWASVLGSAATLVNVPAPQAVPIPEGLDSRIAAAALLQGMTAHYLVHSTYAVRSGDIALVHAAAGGVGQFLVQMITALGGRVIATAGGPEKLETARELGATTLIDYSAESDLAGAVRAASGGEGVHVVYDGVGRSTFDASLASLRRRGMLVLFGGASGQVPPLDLQRLNAGGSLFVTRPRLAHYIATREELLLRADSVLGDLAGGRLRIHIGGEWPLEDAAAAYEALEGRRTTGKLLLIPNADPPVGTDGSGYGAQTD